LYLVKNAVEAHWSAILCSPLLLVLKQGVEGNSNVFLYFVFLIKREMLYDVQNTEY
jgi:hypothetical protein